MCRLCRPRGAESRPGSLLLLALLALCACGKSGLASLSNRRVFIDLGPDRLILNITYDEGGEDCWTLNDFKGFKCTIDGISLDVVNPGVCDRHGPELSYWFPALTLPVERFPADGAGKVRISDDSMEIRIDLPSLFQPRATSLASAVPGMIHPGEEVVVSWTPETDRWGGDTQSIGFYPTGGVDAVFSLSVERTPQDIRLLDSNHLWLRVPQPNPRWHLPIAGFLYPYPISMPIERCEGARCSTGVVHQVEAVFAASPS